MDFNADDVRNLAAKATEAEGEASRIRPDSASYAIASGDRLLVLRRVDRKVRLLPFRPDLRGAVLLTERGAERVARLWNKTHPDRPVSAIPAGRLCGINANRYRRTAEGLALHVASS